MDAPLGESGEFQPPPAGGPNRRFYERDPFRIEVGQTVGFAIILTVFLILVWIGEAGAGSNHWANTRELLEICMPVEATIIGGAVVFFYTSHDR